MGIFSSKTVKGPDAEVITTPQTGYQFQSPYMEDYSRKTSWVLLWFSR